MKIAFLILCHKNEEQINKLLNVLDGEEVDFYIHLDKKSSIMPKIKAGTNIYMLPEEKRINISWGDISMILATKNLLEVIFDADRVYDYVWLISGQDFPIKSKDEIVKYLEENKGKNYIEIIGKNDSCYKRLLKRNELYYPHWIKKNNTICKAIKLLYMIITGGLHRTVLFKRVNNLDTDFYFGSQWWTLTYECTKEIYDMLENSKYIDYYSHCLVPDESIIQTLYMNSSYKDCHSDKLTYVDWTNQLNHPNTFTINDFSKLINSNFFMARKFDENIDNDIIEKLYVHLKR